MAEYKRCWIISIYKAKYFSVVYPNSLYMYTMLNQFTFGSWDTYIRKPPILPSTFWSSLGHINAYHQPIYIFFPRNGFTIYTIFTLTRNEKIQEKINFNSHFNWWNGILACFHHLVSILNSNNTLIKSRKCHLKCGTNHV